MKFLTVLILPLMVFIFNESSCQERKAAKAVQQEANLVEEEQKQSIKESLTQKIDIKDISKEQLMQIDATVPEKLITTLQQFKKKNAKNIMARVFSFDAEDNNTYFMFDEGMAVDRGAYVLNEKADTVCVTGGMRRGRGNLVLHSQETGKPLENQPKQKQNFDCPKEIGNRVILWQNTE